VTQQGRIEFANVDDRETGFALFARGIRNHC
jgi:hypothetical protein